MADAFYIRMTEQGDFGIYREETLLIFGLNNENVQDFCKQRFDSYGSTPGTVDPHLKLVKTVVPPVAPPTWKRGRRLLLEAHLDTMREMIRNNPSITDKEIDANLRSRGVELSGVIAVKSATRRTNLRATA